MAYTIPEATAGLMARLSGTGAFSGARTVSAAWTFSAAGAALTVDNDLRAGRLGIGTAPTETVHIDAGTLGDGRNAFSLIATLPTTPTAAVVSAHVRFTTAGSNSFDRVGWRVQLWQGYTGTSETIAFYGFNNVAGTGAAAWDIGASNVGFRGDSVGTTTGTNYGSVGNAKGGNLNVGCFGIADFSSATKVGIGVGGAASNATGTRIGGLFTTVIGTNPTFESAALIADNMTTTDPIFLVRDNGTKVWQVPDGGWPVWTELTANPGTSVLSSLAAFAVYMKADTFVIAFNNAGTITYAKLVLDGSSTLWTQNTTAP